MKALLVNTHSRGGAANACIRLHEGLLKQNVQSTIFFGTKATTVVPKSYDAKYLRKGLRQKYLDKIFNFLEKTNLYRKNKNEFISKRPQELEMFSFPNSKYDITKLQAYKEADIINLHWASRVLDYTSFFKKNKKPVVWTLHDMNPFSGGEHYEEEFFGIDEHGFPIKREITIEEAKQFDNVLKIKMKALKKVKNLTIVTLCNWMTSQVKQSELFGDFPVYQIPNGIDSKVFKAHNQQSSRKKLKLPIEKKIILFVADDISNFRKGFLYLKKALEGLNDDDFVLCTVGSKAIDFEVPNKIFELGQISDNNLMSIVYSAADVFVIPSLMDNLPNTVLESLFCGTPVIGFPIGGIPDMVQDGQNGYLTDEISVIALSKTINKHLKNIDLLDRKTIREDAVNKYSQEIQAKAYNNLFKSLLS